jgi:hypothetical protein
MASAWSDKEETNGCTFRFRVALRFVVALFFRATLRFDVIMSRTEVSTPLLYKVLVKDIEN